MFIKTLSSFFIIFILTISSTTSIFANTKFDDVPTSHWSYEYVEKLNELGITEGIGNNKFGLGLSITRAEFVTFLTKLFKWDIIAENSIDFSDVKNSDWFFPYVKTALKHGISEENISLFRPLDKITREEMAVMLVKSLGYQELSTQINYLESGFTDVNTNKNYITMAKDFKIITGTGNNLFNPKETATREQAASIMIKTYDLLNSKIIDKNAFYAINSSSQIDMINNFDDISFGWSKLEIDNIDNISLNTTSKNNNEYRIPSGYETPYNMANGKLKMLMVAVDSDTSNKIINDKNLSTKSVSSIANAINNGILLDESNILFDGVVLDFESLKGVTTKDNYNSFIKELKSILSNNKKIFVAVHPQVSNNKEYFDGYDYKTIGEISDKIILMAHDYNTKKLSKAEMENGIVMTPIAPISEIYYSLKMLTDSSTGVLDNNKIMLQISFDTAQWKLIDGKVINEKPFQPTYTTLEERISKGVDKKYSTLYESPYITFYNGEDLTNNVIWYENQQSVNAKIKLAKMFGVNSISIWRLGNIPKDLKITE